jgi:hypothetical protein
MPRSRRRVLVRPVSRIVLLVLLLFNFAAGFASAPAPVRIIAGPVCVEGEPKTDLAGTSSQGVSFSARPLTVQEWEARIAKSSPGGGGLFRGPGGHPAPFQVFLLTVENRNKELVRLQPGNIVRLGGPHEEDHILDYTDLYQYLQGIGKPGEDLDPLRDQFFDSGMILDTGQPVERLLLFREMPPSKKRKAMVLLISSFQVGTETYQASLAWHFEKVK